MTSSTSQNLLTSPYLITSRQFPLDVNLLQPVISKMYTDVALAVNRRQIGIYDAFTVNAGQEWLNTGDPTNRLQVFRQVYPFGAIAAGATLAIPHGITDIQQFTHIYGTCITAQPDYRPIPFASQNQLNTQIAVLVDMAGNIQVSNGAGAPNIVSGNIILEWVYAP